LKVAFSVRGLEIMATNESRDFLIDFAAGWVSGAATIIAGQPFDTVLTRLQSKEGAKKTSRVIMKEVPVF